MWVKEYDASRLLVIEGTAYKAVFPTEINSQFKIKNRNKSRKNNKKYNPKSVKVIHVKHFI